MNTNQLVLWNGMDEALVGYVMNKDLEPIAVYSYSKAVEVFLDQGLEYVDAVEYLHFNLIDAYLGERTPLWLYEGSRPDVEAAEEGMHL